jgi:hypothetical protein
MKNLETNNIMQKSTKIKTNANLDIFSMIDNLKTQILYWHINNYKIFDKNDFDESEILSILIKLAYHDYVGWHMIEDYQNSDKEVIKFVFEGGLIHNISRNYCMQLIDEYYVNMQNENAEFNSEGMGSIFYKLANDYIKYLHLVEDNDNRSSLLETQVSFYEKCLKKLDSDIKSKNKKIIIFQKFKTNGY